MVFLSSPLLKEASSIKASCWISGNTKPRLPVHRSRPPAPFMTGRHAVRQQPYTTTFTWSFHVKLHVFMMTWVTSSYTHNITRLPLKPTIMKPVLSWCMPRDPQLSVDHEDTLVRGSAPLLFLKGCDMVDQELQSVLLS